MYRTASGDPHAFAVRVLRQATESTRPEKDPVDGHECQETTLRISPMKT